MNAVADEKVLEKVRHLIAKIDHPNTPDAERELCRARADKLMMRYAIDRAVLEDGMSREQRETPTKASVDLGETLAEGSTDAAYCFEVLAETNRCETVRRYADISHDIPLKDGSTYAVTRQHYVDDVYGFAADVAFVEMMWTSIQLAFVSKVHPRWDETLSEGENIRRLKTAGFKWEDVARMGGFDWPDGGKMKRIYLRHLRAVGAENERVSTQRHGAYRTSFIRAFYDRLVDRLREIERSHKQQVAEYTAETGNTAAALVLADRSLVVKEALYAEHPSRRPMTAEQMAEWREKVAKRSAERRAREQAEWDALTDKEKAKRRRAEQKAERAWERERNERYRRENDDAGHYAGRAAADSVNLARATGVEGNSRKEIG